MHALFKRAKQYLVKIDYLSKVIRPYPLCKESIGIKASCTTRISCNWQYLL